MMTASRWARRSAFLSLLVSCGLLIASLAGIGRESGDTYLRFQPNPSVFPGALDAGREYDVDVVIINPSSQPARLVGSLDYCGGSCFSARGMPISIPAKSKGHVVVHIQARTPGSLSGELTFYTDRASQPTMVLNLEGTVRDRQPDESTKQAANL